MKRIIVATTNPGKARELMEVLSGVVEVDIPSDLEEVVEDGKSLFENAFKKARSAADALGVAVVADDSGLFVPSLGGKPGVHSARFAGADSDDVSNRSLLKMLLQGESDREGYFETVLCLCRPNETFEEALFFEGRCDGTVLTIDRGHEGFGYDPMFVPKGGDGRTFGEMTSMEKAMFSHRAKAIAKLKVWLEEN